MADDNFDIDNFDNFDDFDTDIFDDILPKRDQLSELPSLNEYESDDIDLRLPKRDQLSELPSTSVHEYESNDEDKLDSDVYEYPESEDEDKLDSDIYDSDEDFAPELDSDEDFAHVFDQKPESRYFNTDNVANPTFMKTQNVGAIGIFTHGIYNTHNLIPLPKNVEVNEYNSAADGCSIKGPIYKRDDELCVAVTKKAVSNLRGCVNEDYVKTVLHNGTEPHIVPILSCNLYLKVRELKEKSFSIEPVEIKTKNDEVLMDHSNIIFMIALNKRIDEEGNQLYKKINLSLCSVDELIDFFKLDPDSELNEEDTSDINDFIVTRNENNEITTRQLVMLISLAKTYLNVGNINILDTSCSQRPLAREGLRSFEQHYRRIFPNKRYLDPNFVTSHGTKKKRNITPDKPKTKRRRLVIKSKPKNRTKNQRTNTTSRTKNQRTNTTSRTKLFKTRKHR